tara:strand:- start:41 stop:262 length:222 start_codon:yes stop_codon:yes gene_type:complete
VEHQQDFMQVVAVVVEMMMVEVLHQIHQMLQEVVEREQVVQDKLQEVELLILVVEVEVHQQEVQLQVVEEVEL